MIIRSTSLPALVPRCSRSNVQKPSRLINCSSNAQAEEREDVSTKKGEEDMSPRGLLVSRVRAPRNSEGSGDASASMLPFWRDFPKKSALRCIERMESGSSSSYSFMEVSEFESYIGKEEKEFGYPKDFGDRFELLEQLGKGGYGTVYKARKRHTGEMFAVKVLLNQAHSELVSVRVPMFSACS
eukprot:1104761-Prorocentrum_minimum.AAC.2